MEFVAKAYQDGSYAEKNYTFGDGTAVWKAENVKKILGLSGVVAKNICEIGCGGAGIINHLQTILPADTQFTGYEPMPEAYAYAKPRETDRLKIINGTLDIIPAGKHDLAIMCDVFEHVEDYIGFLRSASKVAPNFVFHIPLDMNAQMVARETPIRKVRDLVGHLHYFSKYSALATLEYAGFEIVNHFYTDGFYSGQRSFFNSIGHLPRVIAKAIAPDLTVRLLGGFPLMVHARVK